MRNSPFARWAAGLSLAAFMIYAPYLYYRFTLEHSKRLRPVVEGEVYRSGCLSANGFRDAIQKHKIKTVISLWDEDPDPTLKGSRFDWSTIKESDLCKSMDVNYKFIFVKLWPGDSSASISQFLEVMDDKANYPVLFHCKAGLHRTGVMAAIYRMEYDGWSRQDAMRELRAHGFGHFIGNTSNDYIEQYIMHYQPRGKSAAINLGKAQPDAAKPQTKLAEKAPEEIDVKGAYNENGVFVSGKAAIKKDLEIKDFFVTIPAAIGNGGITTLQAKEARYIPESKANQRSGGWLLTNTTPAELPNWPNDQKNILEPLGNGRYFLRTKGVDLETVTRGRSLIQDGIR